MTDRDTPIAPLTKVTLTLRTASAHAKRSVEATPVEFVFVYGIGTGGLTGFEQAILGKSRGESLTLCVDDCQAAAHLEHLFTPLMQTIQTPPPFNLNMEVKAVSPATDRELVQALSQKVSHSGCGCGEGSCGCGC